MTLKKATLAAGVVAMSVGLFNSFNVEAEGGSAGFCNHQTIGDTGVSSYCLDNIVCDVRMGQGTLLLPCGY